VEAVEADSAGMTRVVEAGAGAVVIVHVGPDGGFSLSEALHPDILALALSHGLTTIVVSQRCLSEADTEALLGSGGVADLASADLVPPCLLRRRLEAHVTHSRARALSQSLSSSPSSSSSWQSLSGSTLLPQRSPYSSTEFVTLAEAHEEGGGDSSNHSEQSGPFRSGGSSGSVPVTPRSTAVQHLSVVEGLLLQLDKQGHPFEADYPELSRLVVRLLRDLHSPESSVFQPAETLFKEKCKDSTTRDWIMETYTRRPSLSDLLVQPPSSFKRTLSLSQAGRAVKSWNFNPFECSEDMLESFIPQIFDSELHLLKIFDVPRPVFANFVREVRRHYQANPYHNFVHAFDVLQTVYSLLFITDAINFLTELDIFALLVSALCHDLSHPGTNNAFQVNNLTSLALVYNDVSVLENYHVATLFRILDAGSSGGDATQHANIFANLTKEQFREVRTVIIKNILGTDMSYHFESTNLFKARTCAHTGSGGDKSTVSLRPDVKDDRQLMMKILLHTADISNQAKPWEVASRWAAKVTEEFLAQGELERQAGGPVSPGMDKTNVKMEQMTANFIEVVLEPLFTALAGYFPTLGPQHRLLLDNKSKWRSSALASA
jgi:hypothetical protein